MTQNRAELNRNLAQMLKGGVIMDVTTPEQARIAELSTDLGEAMVGINESEIALLMAERGK